VALVAVAVVWATYLAVDSRPPWTTPRNVPDIRGKRGLVTAWLPVPEPYRDGMRIQFGIEYSTKGGGFLFGRRYFGSLWHYLPYSNGAFGGPSKTHLHLHDSNVDWGQDLGRLAEHLRQRYPDERVWLGYKGSGVPSYYGIDARDPFRAKPEEVRGLLVVSNSAVAKAEPGGPLEALIESSRPIDEVGHSITIFRRD
jgi:hypothetical protein